MKTETTRKSDRYVSFSGIDFEENMRKVLEHLRRHTSETIHDNAFWQKFWKRMEIANSNSVPVSDKLLLLHSHTYYMTDLFEEVEDEIALRDLKTLESECF